MSSVFRRSRSDDEGRRPPQLTVLRGKTWTSADARSVGCYNVNGHWMNLVSPAALELNWRLSMCFEALRSRIMSPTGPNGGRMREIYPDDRQRWKAFVRLALAAFVAHPKSMGNLLTPSATKQKYVDVSLGILLIWRALNLRPDWYATSGAHTSGIPDFPWSIVEQKAGRLCSQEHLEEVIFWAENKLLAGVANLDTPNVYHFTGHDRSSKNQEVNVDHAVLYQLAFAQHVFAMWPNNGRPSQSTLAKVVARIHAFLDLVGSFDHEFREKYQNTVMPLDMELAFGTIILMHGFGKCCEFFLDKLSAEPLSGSTNKPRATLYPSVCTFDDVWQRTWGRWRGRFEATLSPKGETLTSGGETHSYLREQLHFGTSEVNPALSAVRMDLSIQWVTTGGMGGTADGRRILRPYGSDGVNPEQAYPIGSTSGTGQGYPGPQ